MVIVDPVPAVIDRLAFVPAGVESNEVWVLYACTKYVALLKPVFGSMCDIVPAQLSVAVEPPAVAYAVITTSATSTTAVAVPVLNAVHRAVSDVVPAVPKRIVKVVAPVPAADLDILILHVINVPFWFEPVGPIRPAVPSGTVEPLTIVSVPAAGACVAVDTATLVDGVQLVQALPS
jgi:hypothetical protein